jgi:hypothetical protein
MLGIRVLAPTTGQQALILGNLSAQGNFDSVQPTCEPGMVAEYQSEDGSSNFSERPTVAPISGLEKNSVLETEPLRSNNPEQGKLSLLEQAKP